MTTQDIAKIISDKYLFPTKDVRDMLDLCFNLIKTTLEEGEDVNIPHFGKFYLRDYKARKHSTFGGELLSKPARKRVKFNPHYSILEIGK